MKNRTVFIFIILYVVKNFACFEVKSLFKLKTIVIAIKNYEKDQTSR